MSEKIPVAILGATGTVGQKFVRLLADHPWFEIAAVAASASSAGRRYAEAARWREPMALPAHIGDMIVRECAAPLPARIVFSALDAEVAGPIEQAFAQTGAYVVTNTRTHRMEPDVPLLIPEANADHLSLIDRQCQERGWKGAILANPNCSTAALALALAPLHQAFEVERIFVSTMQAVSGAGYPGVASLDIVGNVIPHIGGEEEKIERETRKVLGTLSAGLVQPAEFAVSAHTNRVPVVDGHMMTVSVPRTAVCGRPSLIPIASDRGGRSPRPAAASPGSRPWPRHGRHRRTNSSLPGTGHANGGAGSQHHTRGGRSGRSDR
jgi:aspartate-semialdehyde dehydrogenase